MLDNAQTLAAQYGMLPPGCTVLCAVSGGADSVCLLHCLYDWGIFDGFTVVAAHYNHQLRGAESDRDEAFVRDLCANWPPVRNRHFYHSYTGETIPAPIPRLIVGRGDVAGEAKRLRRGVEETAREMRYAFLEEAALEVGADFIATAHNADDNAETVLMHLLRGCGLQGMCGIPPRQGKLIRPLLTTTRAEIEKYLCCHRLPHVEDSTNTDESYLRNRVRHTLLPMLEEWNPGFVDRVTAAVPTLRADNDYLNALAADLSKKAVVENGTVALPALFVAGAPGPVAVRVARQLLGMVPGGSTDCSMAHLDAMVDLCRSDCPSGVVRLPHGVIARREYKKLILTTGGPPAPLETIPITGAVTPIPGTNWTALLDGPPWPGLMVRSRRTGDAITLAGRPGRTLKRLFIDRKIPLWERQRIPVAADDDGVLAVAGLGANTAHPKGAQVRFIHTNESIGGAV